MASSSKSTKFTAKVRLQGKTTASASKASKSGKLKLTLKSRKALKKGQKVVLTRQERQDDQGVHRQGVLDVNAGPRRTRRGPSSAPQRLGNSTACALLTHAF